MTEQERARWVRLVADFEASDLTQREFATERGISFSNLRNWLYKLRKESRPLEPEPPKVPGVDAHQDPRIAGLPAGGLRISRKLAVTVSRE
jgi:hypothetical protein